MWYIGRTSCWSPFRGTTQLRRDWTSSMSHRSENGTKVFSVPGKIPGTFPGKRAFFGGIFPGCFLDGKIPGSIPGKMPRFQSATVVLLLVSISDEKPLHMRRHLLARNHHPASCFNLR